ncbi:MAG: ATP-binding protein [Candidatus Brocadiaceae bacterium]|nr:ATP-binding protein [Candidatus Brocadiaceae bacterium]
MIEYKQELPGNSDTDKKEFLADVSSFANASGGDLIYGIVEDKGIPIELKGLTIENIDSEISRLENIIRDGIGPRISGVAISKPICLLNSKVALIIRVPKSWISPHRVIFKSHDKFYSRSTTGKYPMDVGELRVAFNLSETITERIRNFRVDRISKIRANETPVPLVDTAKIALHLIPVISFNPAQRYEISRIASHPEKMPPIYQSSGLSRYNLDGFLTYYHQEDRVEGKSRFYSYVQLFNNGIVEAVEGKLLNPKRPAGLYIPSGAYEKALIKSVSDYFGVLKLLNVDLPIIVFLTLIGVKGYYMAVDVTTVGASETIDRDILPLPENIIESYNDSAENILRPCFDSIWNACGFSRSHNYDASGRWIAK